MAKTDALLASIGGQLTEAEAKTLILKKLYDLANSELNRYLNAEKRRLHPGGRKPLGQIRRLQPRTWKSERAETLTTLDGFLEWIGVFGDD